MKNRIHTKCNMVNRGSKRKIIIIAVAFILLMIIAGFFIKNHYKIKNIGNNMSNKNVEEIEEYILNISSYKAKIEVTIESNKNKNKYLIEQIYQKDKMSKQTILEPSNVEGLEMTYEAGTLTINHSKMNLVTVYENYNDLLDNFLWLDAFIKDYTENKEQASIIQENDMIIMETKTRNENNRYVCYKKLWIDKKTGKPTKLLIEDINKKNLVYILYNEIMVNG